MFFTSTFIEQNLPYVNTCTSIRCQFLVGSRSSDGYREHYFCRVPHGPQKLEALECALYFVVVNIHDLVVPIFQKQMPGNFCL